MSDVTSGPIQTYVDDSILTSPTVSQNSIQERISVTLTDSNLWLVDPSKLNGQTVDSQTQYTLLNLQTKYQTTVPFDNVNFNATTIAPASLTSSESSYLQSNLPQGNALMLAEVTGGTRLGSEGMSLASTGSSDGTSGTSSGGSSGGLSGGGGAGSSGAGVSPPSDSSSPEQSTNTPPNTTGVTPQPSVNPSAIPQTPVPVPFEASPTVGLLLLLFVFGYKWMLKKMRLEHQVSHYSGALKN